MAALGPLLNVVLGLAVVMTGVSMLVYVIVGVIHRTTKVRTRELAEMLAATNYAFRVHHGDRAATRGDQACANFTRDILADAAVRPADEVLDPWAADAKQSSIEFISQEDLRKVIERHCKGGRLPETWYTDLPDSAANQWTFERWLKQWFPTIEDSAKDRFRRESVRLVTVISAIAVVALNLDAFQLSFDLFKSSTLADALHAHTDGLLDLADRLESNDDGETVQDLIQINSMLNVPELRIGWQHSAFIDHYCAWRGRCDSSSPSLTERAPATIDGADFALYLARWFVGLVASVMLLSLGAPFWADRLRDLLRLRSTRQQKVQSS